MSQKASIQTVNQYSTIDRTGEALGPIWNASNSPIKSPIKQGPFLFTGEKSEISITISTLISTTKERLLISSQSFSDSSIIEATQSAIQKGIRVYIVLDSHGFEAMLSNPSCKALLGNVLLRERQDRGLDLILSDWHLANRRGFLLTTPLDGTITSSTGNWAMELSKSQIDEFSSHIQHEFWSIIEGREVLSPDEVKNPKPIAQAPFTLRALHNHDWIIRANLVRDGVLAGMAELSLRKENDWHALFAVNLSKNNILLHGESIELGAGANQILLSNPRNVAPNTGLYAHSRQSLQLAIGAESYLAGWDRTANGDWHSILRLTAEQAKAAQSLLSKFSKSPEWIGHSKIKLGEAGNRIIRDGTEMEISDSQTQDLGVIHLDKMPDSSAALQSHKPELIPPSDSLARQCEFKWISAPPVPSKSASEDQLHDDWDNARDEISARLNSLDKLNVVTKIPGFGRKAKELQKSINAAIEKLETINDPKSLTNLVDEVEKLTKSVSGNLDAIKAAEDEEARQKLEDEQREAHELAVDNAKDSVKDLEPRLKKMNAELKKLQKSSEKAKDVEKKKLDSDIEQLLPQIKQLESDMKSANEIIKSKFEFKAPPTLPSSKKKDRKSHKFLGDTRESKLDVKIPKEGLPTFGTLFKDGDIRYLAVSDWDHVEQGRKDAMRLNATLCASREVLN